MLRCACRANIRLSSSVLAFCRAARRGSRVRKPLVWMTDYVGHVSSVETLTFPNARVTPHTFPFVVSPGFTSSYTTFLLNMHMVKEPTSYKKACSSPEWVAAIDFELMALEHNHTWILTTLPTGKKLIGSKWVYKTEFRADGMTVERFKIRLVAEGYTKEYEVDYSKVFSPVAKLVIVGFLITVATTSFQ